MLACHVLSQANPEVRSVSTSQATPLERTAGFHLPLQVARMGTVGFIPSKLPPKLSRTLNLQRSTLNPVYPYITLI